MPKPWLANYPKGVPATIAPLRYDSLADFFVDKARQFGCKSAFSNNGISLSYAETECQSRYFASFLLSLDLAPKTRIAIVLPNILQYPVALLGVLRAGMVAVNTNPQYTGRELAHQLHDSGATVIIILDQVLSVFESIQAQTAINHIIVTSLVEQLPWFKSIEPKLMVTDADGQQLTTWFCQALTIGKQHTFIAPKIAQHDLAFLQYTGGTTGLSKGAMLSHKNLLSNLQQIDLWITHGSSPEATLHAGEEVVITALPLYHIFALTANFLCFIDLGAENVLITKPRDMVAFIKLLQTKKFSCMTGVNTLYDGLMQTDGFEQIDFSSLKLALAGGMATRKVMAQRWQKLTGCALIESYGLTEASPAVTINPLYIKEFTGSIGQPLPSTECQIRDPKGQVLGIEAIGELYIRGPQVMQGFWQQTSTNTEQLSADGWLKTGDIVRMDAQGFFYLVDRAKDMILVSGFNVYPNEIEAVINLHPDILECAVIGVADSNSGEAIKAYVVSNNPALKKQVLIDHCRLNLTAYKIPKLIEFIDSLPKTTVGKILRRSLKDLNKENAS